jgi:hypothetical protein
MTLKDLNEELEIITMNTDIYNLFGYENVVGQDSLRRSDKKGKNKLATKLLQSKTEGI